MKIQIYSQPWDIQNRLAEIGLQIELLQRSAEAGYSAFVSCTENDPVFVRGFNTWSRTLRRLREELIPLGWKRIDSGNFPRTSSPKHSTSIIVMSGDEGTGLGHLHPRPKSPRGSLTAQAVHVNNIQGTFKDFLPEEEREDLPISGYKTWVFLVHISSSEIRAELSYPVVIESGKILAWKERILLPPTDIDPSAFEFTPDDLGPEIDVKVERKTS